MMSDQDIWEILKILAGLLHMGNIKYKGKVVDNLDATDIPDKANVELVANILGVNLLSLISGVLNYPLSYFSSQVLGRQIDLEAVRMVIIMGHNDFNENCHSKYRPFPFPSCELSPSKSYECQKIV